MTHGLAFSNTRALVTVVVALALLLTAPLAIAALETNPITGAAMRSFEGTSVGQVVSSLSADADAAISRSQQASRAAGRASFFCFAWQCRSYYRRTAVYTSTGTLKTTWRLNYPRNMLWHGECRTYANMAISVTSSGGIRGSLINCG